MPLEKLNNKKTIETDILNVKGNLISWKDTFIQISSISMISTADVAKTPFPIWSILLGLVGIFLIKASTLFGLLLLIICGIWIYTWYKESERLNKLKKLNIVLNSGGTYTLVFNDKHFLDQVVSILENILSTSDKSSNITFNIKNNTFEGKSSVIKNSTLG